MCTGGVLQPGLQPLAIRDPSRDVVMCKAADGQGGVWAQARHCTAPAH